MSLNRCMQCHGTLKHDELECFLCGSAVPQKEDSKAAFARRFSKTTSILFIIFSALSAISLFVDAMPPTADLAAVTGILGLVRSSASQMIEKHSRGH